VSSFDNRVIEAEAILRGKAGCSKDAEGVIDKGLFGIHRSSCDFGGEIGDTADEVFYDFGVDIVEEGIDGKISSFGIFLRGAKGDGRDSGIAISFGAKVGEVDGGAEDFGCSGGEMFGLFWIGFDDGDFGRIEILFREIVLNEVSKFLSGFIGDGDIDIGAFPAEEFVTNKSAGYAQDGGR